MSLEQKLYTGGAKADQEALLKFVAGYPRTPKDVELPVSIVGLSRRTLDYSARSRSWEYLSRQSHSLGGKLSVMLSPSLVRPSSMQFVSEQAGLDRRPDTYFSLSGASLTYVETIEEIDTEVMTPEQQEVFFAALGQGKPIELEGPVKLRQSGDDPSSAAYSTEYRGNIELVSLVTP